MREEIASAVVFVSRLVKINDDIPKEKVEEFSSILSANLIDRFKNHWYIEDPNKGQGYRCIRINPSEPIDPVLEKAANDCGLQYADLNLPQELTLWVDPKEVCCRFGESRGSYCQLAVMKEGNLENQAHTINIEDHLNRQQQRLNMNLNVVMMRTSANKLKAMAMKSAVFQQQHQQTTYYHNNNYQQNHYNNQQPSQQFTSNRPFQKSHQPKSNSFQNNQSVNNSYNGYQGNKAGGNFKASANTTQPMNKDRFHWVKNKHHNQPQDQTEKMRLSPN